MDINMPLKSGIEAKKEVCNLFEQFNSGKSSQQDSEQQSQGTLADRV